MRRSRVHLLTDAFSINESTESAGPTLRLSRDVAISVERVEVIEKILLDAFTLGDYPKATPTIPERIAMGSGLGLVASALLTVVVFLATTKGVRPVGLQIVVDAGVWAVITTLLVYLVAAVWLAVVSIGQFVQQQGSKRLLNALQVSAERACVKLLRTRFPVSDLEYVEERSRAERSVQLRLLGTLAALVVFVCGPVFDELIRPVLGSVKNLFPWSPVAFGIFTISYILIVAMQSPIARLERAAYLLRLAARPFD